MQTKPIELPAATRLEQHEVDTFWEQGFLPKGRILTDDELDRLRREYDAEFKKAWDENSLRNLSIDNGSDSETKRKAPKQMLQIMQMCERNIHYRKLIYNDRILDIVADLMGPSIQLFHDQALFKPAHVGGPVNWHQDNAYWKCRPANLVSCWLTLDDVKRENGAMQLIPGSHLKPVSHEQSDSTNALLNLKGVDESKAVVVELPAGGCMFHHCQTLHYTQPNTTDNQRRALAIHFMPLGTYSESMGRIMPVSYSNPLLRFCTG
jgi:ectoine hydroxylase-related dioxygenase (phytanoyl-CoA dioxygenase family)